MAPEIIQAHNKWKTAENKIPEKEYQKGYKSRLATARKLWRIFSDLCKVNDLKPVEVASSLSTKHFKINLCNN